MARYVIDAHTLLHLVDSDVTIAPSHQLVAPNSIRSEALQLLLRDVRRGGRTRQDALKSHERMTELKMRLLGDRVSRRTAWDIALEPGNVEKAHHFFANGAVAAATTEHPEEAFAWVQFLTGSDAAVQTRIDASWELAAVSDLSLFEPYLEQTPPDTREVVFEALDAIVVPPVIEQQAQMQDIVSQELARAVLGEITAQEALDSAAEQVQALLP